MNETEQVFDFTSDIPERIKALVSELKSELIASPTLDRIEILNLIKTELHSVSPFKDDPVDCVVWVQKERVQANDYNPNSVAPPEMKLLERSILRDGYTQPIVGWQRDKTIEVVDGFHRNRVGKESIEVGKRVHGYLPVTIVNDSRLDRGDRIAATIRHNRARGKHKVDAMSDIVVELKRRNWSNEKIGSELGMDPDEVLRLCQISGLAEMFKDQEFSKSWEVDGIISDSDIEELNETSVEEKEFRTVNTSDPERIFHTYEKWECYAAGFYNTTIEGMTKEEAQKAYKEFLSDTRRFSKALKSVITEWTNSCEHYLTNKAMNRIAWLGQAAACYDMGIPSTFRSGFNHLSEKEKETANKTALKALNIWRKKKGLARISLGEALSNGRQSDIY